MPLPVAHMFLGAALAEALLPAQTAQRKGKVFTAALLAVAPDLDFLPILALGIDRSLHRGCSHSLTFAAIAGLLGCLLLGRSRARESIVYASALLSHGLLDAMATVHGRGVELLWPWAQSRYKWGLTDLLESHLEPTATWQQTLGDLLQQTVIEAVAFGLLLWAVIQLRDRVSSIA